MPGHPPGSGSHPPAASGGHGTSLSQPVASIGQLRPPAPLQPDKSHAATRLAARFLLLLACFASLAACAAPNPRLDDNARAAADHGNGGPQGEWGSLGGGWSGPGNMGW
ncbi:hypothetical protein [Komagataeibacter xylinus]|uniref:hypothetical protein n=1 Tax=Komagataeibacter xylinus TaxID=28448 RepID=UPI001F5FCB2F|nr:hypothetical protein [Komagataeibacter xylinus]